MEVRGTAQGLRSAGSSSREGQMGKGNKKCESFGNGGLLVFRLMCAYDTSSIEWVDGWYPAEGLYNSPFFYASIIDWEFLDSSSDGSSISGLHCEADELDMLQLASMNGHGTFLSNPRLICRCRVEGEYLVKIASWLTYIPVNLLKCSRYNRQPSFCHATRGGVVNTCSPEVSFQRAPPSHSSKLFSTKP